MDRVNLTLLSLWIHVPVVTAWIGLVMLDVVALATPGLPTAQRARMMMWSRPFVVGAIVLITATGVWQTIDNPIRLITSVEALQQLREQTVYGLALFWKHGCVITTFGLTVLVRFVLAPRLLVSALDLGLETAATAALRERQLLWLSALNLVACLAALLFATRMIWVLH
jgi:hypothetical protein